LIINLVATGECTLEGGGSSAHTIQFILVHYHYFLLDFMLLTIQEQVSCVTYAYLHQLAQQEVSKRWSLENDGADDVLGIHSDNRQWTNQCNSNDNNGTMVAKEKRD
jgi:hypothetical protein